MRLGATIDTRTARLIAIARAAQTTKQLPIETARDMVSLARGVRLYLEANQPRLALRCVQEMRMLTLEMTDDVDLQQAFASTINSMADSEAFKHLPAPEHTTPTPTP